MLRWLKNIDWGPIVAAIFVLIFAFSVLPTLSNYEKQKINNQTENQSGDYQPASVSGLSIWIHRNHDEIGAISTAIIAAFTIVLAWMAARQIKDTHILRRAYIAVIPGEVRPFSGSATRTIRKSLAM